VIFVVVHGAISTAAHTEECSNAECILKAALADDDDVPLSLLQVKAVGLRNTRTPLASTSNQSLRIAGTISKDSVEAITGKIFTTGFLATPITLESARGMYLASALFVIVVVLNSTLICSQLQGKVSIKKQHTPTMRHPVDHLVAASKLKFGNDAMHKQVSLYAKEQARHDNDICESRVSATSPDGDLSTMSPQENLTEKAWHFEEALDPKLVLPLRETWYAVAIEHALDNNGSFDIRRITGYPSLRACITHSNGCSALELYCCSGGSRPSLISRCSSREPRRKQRSIGANEAAALPLELIDAQSRNLGELRPITCKSFDFICNGDVVISILVDDSGQLEMSAAGGRRLACASYLAGHLSICINAGADSGLIIGLILAVVLLADTATYMMPKADRGSSCGKPTID
jgi:hypothetical protein